MPGDGPGDHGARGGAEGGRGADGAGGGHFRLWSAVLEEAGLAVQLAGNLPRRPKADKEDARRIAWLAEMGCCGPRSCRREHRHLPGRALPPPFLPSRRWRADEGRLRRGPVRPGHRLAPSERPAARYRDLGPDWHARHTDRSRKARNARRQLEALGYDVIITLAGRRLMSTSTATLRAPRSSRMIFAWAAQAHARSG